MEGDQIKDGTKCELSVHTSKGHIRQHTLAGGHPPSTGFLQHDTSNLPAKVGQLNLEGSTEGGSVDGTVWIVMMAVISSREG